MQVRSFLNLPDGNSQSIMGRAWASGGMSYAWVTTVYVHIKLQLSKSTIIGGSGVYKKGADKIGVLDNNWVKWKFVASYSANDRVIL